MNTILTRRWRRLWHDRRGVAALEMALVATFLLLPITAGIAGTGQALITQYRVDLGLHAGLMYAWGQPAATTSQIITAAQASTGPTNTVVTATASIACYCIPSTGTRASGTAATCGSTCTTTGTVNAQYTTVNTSSSFTPIFPIPWGTTSWTLSATGTVRVK